MPVHLSFVESHSHSRTLTHTHTHTHTQTIHKAILDGVRKANEQIAQAAQSGMPSLFSMTAKYMGLGGGEGWMSAPAPHQPAITRSERARVVEERDQVRRLSERRGDGSSGSGLTSPVILEAGTVEARMRGRASRGSIGAGGGAEGWRGSGGAGSIPKAATTYATPIGAGVSIKATGSTSQTMPWKRTTGGVVEGW
jgi:hypothetical protein